MFRSVLPRASPRASLRACGPKAFPSNLVARPTVFIGVSKRGYASESGKRSFVPQFSACRNDFPGFPDATANSRYIGDHDLVIIGGGVAGYVAAIKAGQEGLKVCRRSFSNTTAFKQKLLHMFHSRLG